MAEDTKDPGDYGETKEPEVNENEDGSVIVKLTPPPQDMPEEVYNLVSHFSGTDDGKKFLKKVADKVVEDFESDWESSGDWRKKRKDRWKLLVGNLDPKTYPFTDCANVHIPVMLERVLRLVHRLYAEMFPDRDFVFTAVPSSQLSNDRAEILTLDQNWRLRKESPDFYKQNRRGLMEFIANGDCIFYSARDIPNKRNKHEALHCEEVAIPYVWKTTAIDMSDVPRKTRILRKYKHELLDLSDSGVYANIEEIFEKEESGDFDGQPDLTVRPTVDKYEGKEAPKKDKHAPYTLYEYHGWCKLPGQQRERPIVATVEGKTRTLVCLFLREQEDWKDRARFARQSQELSEFQQSQAMHQHLQMQEMQVQQRLSMPDVPPEERDALMGTLAQTQPPPPQSPQWMKPGMMAPDPVRMVPIEYFSHGVCIENIDGSLGFGIGLLLEPFNQAANTAASQFTDSATLSNVATVIMPDSVKMEPGDMRLSPGEVHRVRGVSAEQIQNAFKVIQFPPANPQLMEIIKLMLESADGVSSAPDVLSGEAGKANETYRGIATRVEQATKQLTVLAQNYLEMLSNVVRNDARLNAVFMDDSEMKSVIDPRTLESKDIQISRQMYAEDYEIIFTADTRFSGREQKKSDADQVVGMVTSLPPPLAQTIFPPSFVHEAVVRALKSRGLHDMIRYLGPPPPVPQISAGMGPPPGMQPPGMSPGGPPQGAGPGGPPQGPPPGGPPPGQRIPGPQAPPPQ